MAGDHMGKLRVELTYHPEKETLRWAFILERLCCGDDTRIFYLSKLLSPEVEAYLITPKRLDRFWMYSSPPAAWKKVQDVKRLVPQGPSLVIFVPERFQNNSEAWHSFTI